MALSGTYKELTTVLLTWILGEKISPIEVDAVLLSHSDITQAVCFGVPDDKYGEEVKDIILYYLSCSHLLSYSIKDFIGFVLYLLLAVPINYGYNIHSIVIVYLLYL